MKSLADKSMPNAAKVPLQPLVIQFDLRRDPSPRSHSSGIATEILGGYREQLTTNTPYSATLPEFTGHKVHERKSQTETGVDRQREKITRLHCRKRHQTRSTRPIRVLATTDSRNVEAASRESSRTLAIH